MKINNKIALLIVPAAIFSFLQIEFAYEKYNLFINEYNRELWANHTANSIFTYSYILTLAQITLGYIFLTRKRNNFSAIKIILGVILTVSIIISIAASTWLFIMHDKHMLVKYSEWLLYNKGLIN